MGVDVRARQSDRADLGGGTLVSTGVNNNTYTSQTFPLDFTGSHSCIWCSARSRDPARRRAWA